MVERLGLELARSFRSGRGIPAAARRPAERPSAQIRVRHRAHDSWQLLFNKVPPEMMIPCSGTRSHYGNGSKPVFQTVPQSAALLGWNRRTFAEVELEKIVLWLYVYCVMVIYQFSKQISGHCIRVVQASELWAVWHLRSSVIVRQCWFSKGAKN